MTSLNRKFQCWMALVSIPLVLAFTAPLQATAGEVETSIRCTSNLEYRHGNYLDLTISRLNGGKSTLKFAEDAKMLGSERISPVTGDAVYTFLNLITFHVENTRQINGPDSSAAEWNKVSTAIDVAFSDTDYIDRKESFLITIPFGAPEKSTLTIYTIERTRNPIDFTGAFAKPWGSWSSYLKPVSYPLVCQIQ